jgi:uncharacterized protein (DUF1800 family)
MALLDPYTGPWTKAEAAHLSRRTTFGATAAELSARESAGVSVAVDSIVDYAPIDSNLEQLINALPGGTAENNRLKDPVDARDIEGWWLFRMVHSSQPLQQQFALFLHDHFVSEYGKTSANVPNASNEGNDGSQAGQPCLSTINPLPPDPTRKRRIVARLLQDQHRLFLEKGHADFRSMLIDITRDPCMLIYLDNRLNTKNRPQENYAREIMELFSMGVGNYTENDVQAMARAFTGETIRVGCALGWPYDYTYSTNNHDTSSKTVFGVNFSNPNTTAGLDTVKCIDLILERVSGSNVSPHHKVYPATAVYMSWKFMRWFVNETIPIDHQAVGELADFFYNNTSVSGYRYNVRETLRKLFKSQFFYDSSNRLKIIKHPADYIVTALRSLGLSDSSYTGSVYSSMRNMGMRLFEPPNVAGWEHGRTWINSSSVIARFNYANRMSTTNVLTNAAIDALLANSTFADYTDHAGIMNYFAERLLLDSLTPDEAAVFNQLFVDVDAGSTATGLSLFRKKVRAALHLTMTMPRYQLK